MPDAARPETAISRREGLGMITLRADLAEPRLPAALAAAGCLLPGRRRIAAGSGGEAAWMSPDELMLFVPATEVPARLAALGAGLAGVHHLAVDVSDARAVFEVAGPAARRVVAAGAPVDLVPEAFGPGDFRRSRLGQVAAAIWMHAPDAIELMCFRSVADFVADWLAQASRDAGAPGPF